MLLLDGLDRFLTQGSVLIPTLSFLLGACLVWICGVGAWVGYIGRIDRPRIRVHTTRGAGKHQGLHLLITAEGSLNANGDGLLENTPEKVRRLVQ